jgi:hypothetical protein
LDILICKKTEAFFYSFLLHLFHLAPLSKGRPSAKGKFWELRTTATKPPGVTLVDMVIYKELIEKSYARHNSYRKRKKDEEQGKTNR